MLLSGEQIQQAIESGHLFLNPFLPDGIQPVSIDLHLDSTIRVYPKDPIAGVAINPEKLNVIDHIPRYTEKVDLSGDQPWKFEPQRFVIGQTQETVGLPFDLAGRVEGRSRLARLGVGVHITAPKIDPGFHNQITLEMYSLGPVTIELTDGMPICTLLIERLEKPVAEGYTGMFQGHTSK